MAQTSENKFALPRAAPPLESTDSPMSSCSETSQPALDISSQVMRFSNPAMQGYGVEASEGLLEEAVKKMQPNDMQTGYSGDAAGCFCYEIAWLLCAGSGSRVPSSIVWP